MEFNFEFCDVCGTKLVDFIEGQCCGKKCPKCNEAKIVTSYFSVLASDSTIYKIEVLPNNETSLNNIKIIAKLGNYNFVTSKKLLNDGGILVEDNAVNIYEKIKDLDFTKIKYTITPDYPHK